MQRITIGRYNKAIAELPVIGQIAELLCIEELISGWIEGVRDDGTEWIMWIDAAGSPAFYWPTRDESGSVIGDPIDLAPSSTG